MKIHQNLALGIAASIGLASPALADIGYHGHENRAGEPIEIAIELAEFDLLSAAGRDMLDREVKRVVDEVCPPNRSMQNAKDWRNFKRQLAECRVSTYAQIEPKVELAIREATRAESRTELAELRSE